MVKSFAKSAFIACFCAVSIASAQPETKNALYCHPISLIVSTAVKEFPLMLGLTYERELKPKVALVLTPSFWQWSLDDEIDGKLLALNFGLGAGVRRYLAKPASGIFLQAKANLGYMTISVDDPSSGTASASGVTTSLLGMVGYKGQWDKIAMFIDFGLGYQYYGANAKDVNSDVDMSMSGTGLGVGGDFALGYCF